MRSKSTNGYDSRILEVLHSKPALWDVEKIRVNAEIGNWNTCLKHLLSLMIDHKISGAKTSKSWVFWAPESKQIVGAV